MGGLAASAVLPTRACVVHLFGRARVQVGDAELAIRGPIKRGLVAMLALDLGRAVHADQLVDGLWEDDADGDVLRSLRVHISQLRTFLDEQVPGARQFVEGRYPLYRLSDLVSTDFSCASALRDRALDRLSDDPEGSLADLDAARRLVPDEPLAEVLHLPFARFAVEPLRAFQLQLADDYAEVATAAWGSAKGGVARDDRVAAVPMDERRWRLFTRLVDASSDPAAAGEVVPPAGAPRRPRRLRSVPELPDEDGEGPTLPPELASRVPVVFVGRQRERASLLELAASVARERRTRVAQIIGPGGVGKTSLAASLASELAADGSVVLYASWSGPALAAFAPFVAAGLVQPVDGDQALTTAPLGQDALAAEIIDRIREYGDERVTIILDNVHRLPPRYHSVLARVLDCPDIAIFAVMLQRPDPTGDAFEGLLPGDVRRIRLRAFSDSELDELTEALGDSAQPDAGRNLPWVAGLLLAAPSDPTDDRIGEAIEQLAPGDRALLERLALAPDGLMLRTLQHDSGLTAVETLDRVRRLVADGLVTELPGRPPRFVIAHELVGDAVCDRAGPATCLQVSASLHDALEVTGAAVGERVQHAITGADLLGSRAEDTLIAAARLLVRDGAFADAIALAEAAHEAGAVRAARARSVVDGARLLAQAALGERTDAARRLQDLAQDAADLEDWDTVTNVLQWRTRLGANQLAGPGVRELLKSALAAVDTAEPRLRFEILWCLVFDTMFGNGRISDAVSFADELRPIADDLRDPALRVRALLVGHWVYATTGASAEVLEELSDTAAQYAEDTNDDLLIAAAHASRIGNAMRTHQIDAVVPHVEALHRSRDPLTRWRAHMFDATLQLDDLALPEAEATINRASQYARDRGLMIRGDEAAAQSFVLAWVLGVLGPLRGLLEGLDPGSPGYHGWMAALALARLATGDLQDAVMLGEELVATATEVSDSDWYAVIAAALLSDVAFFGQAPLIAEHVVSRLSAMSGGRVTLGLAVDLGPVDRCLALAHSALGADAEADRLRESARAQAGCKLWLARAEHDELATGRIIPATEIPWSWIETSGA